MAALEARVEIVGYDFNIYSVNKNMGKMRLKVLILFIHVKIILLPQNYYY